MQSMTWQVHRGEVHEDPKSGEGAPAAEFGSEAHVGIEEGR